MYDSQNTSCKMIQNTFHVSNKRQRGMTCDDWPHTKYFGSLVIILGPIDFSLLILTLNDA